MALMLVSMLIQVGRILEVVVLALVVAKHAAVAAFQENVRRSGDKSEGVLVDVDHVVGNAGAVIAAGDDRRMTCRCGLRTRYRRYR